MTCSLSVLFIVTKSGGVNRWLCLFFCDCKRGVIRSLCVPLEPPLHLAAAPPSLPNAFPRLSGSCHGSGRPNLASSHPPPPVTPSSHASPLGYALIRPPPPSTSSPSPPAQYPIATSLSPPSLPRTPNPTHSRSIRSCSPPPLAQSVSNPPSPLRPHPHSSLPPSSPLVLPAHPSLMLWA